MTKTTYLDDLEGNGIELYCESPEDGTWTFKDGKFESYRKDVSWSDGREALDLNELFSHLTDEDKLDVPIPSETRIGHVHLHVRDVDEGVDFYPGVIGFDVMGASRQFQMGFVSAGGYHHHLGLNTWQGEGAPPPPPDAVGLRYFTIDLPTQEAYDAVVARVIANCLGLSRLPALVIRADCLKLRAACEPSRLGEGSLSRLRSAGGRDSSPARMSSSRAGEEPRSTACDRWHDAPRQRVNYASPARRNGDPR